MTTIVILLAVIIALLAVLIFQQERQYRELIRLLNDLATMIGELFPTQGE